MKPSVIGHAPHAPARIEVAEHPAGQSPGALGQFIGDMDSQQARVGLRRNHKSHFIVTHDQEVWRSHCAPALVKRCLPLHHDFLDVKGQAQNHSG